MEVKWGEEEKRGGRARIISSSRNQGLRERRAVPVQSTNDLSLSPLPPIPPPNQGRACKDPDSGAAVEPQGDGSRYLGAASEAEGTCFVVVRPRKTRNDGLGEFMCPFYFLRRCRNENFFSVSALGPQVAPCPRCRRKRSETAQGPISSQY